jgi:HEAT repeat protein
VYERGTGQVLAVLVMPAVADEVDDLILDLKYGRSEVRVEAALALGLIEDARVVDPLINALKDEE